MNTKHRTKSAIRSGHLLLGISCAAGVMLSSAAVYIPAAFAAGQDGAPLYQQKCAACHTIGKGKLVGPDLAGTAKWKDADLTAAVKRMAANVGSLSDDEVRALVTYLKSPAAGQATAATSAAPASTSQQPPAPAGAPPAQPVGEQPQSILGSAVNGRKLFYGEQPLANGGVSCIACHQSERDGGTLGPSLDGIADKMPAAGLLSSCETTPFKVMKQTYAAHPITKQEAMDLTAYFESLKTAPKQGQNVPVDLIAVGGSIVMMLLIAWGYRHRNTSVREKLKRR